LGNVEIANKKLHEHYQKRAVGGAIEDGDRTIFSAFEWKMFGNHIRFWDVRWKDGIPAVVY
jgi:hypothetical protein